MREHENLTTSSKFQKAGDDSLLEALVERGDRVIEDERRPSVCDRRVGEKQRERNHTRLSLAQHAVWGDISLPSDDCQLKLDLALGVSSFDRFHAQEVGAERLHLGRESFLVS